MYRENTENPVYAATASATQRLETERRVTATRLLSLETQVIQMEVVMNVEPRWTTTSPEYIATLEYMSSRDVELKLDVLERLVVQRIFELSRLNIAETGKCLSVWD